VNYDWATIFDDAINVDDYLQIQRLISNDFFAKIITLIMKGSIQCHNCYQDIFPRHKGHY